MQKFWLVVGLGMSLILLHPRLGFAQKVENFGISGSIEVGFEKVEGEKSNLSAGDIEVSVDVRLNDNVSGNVLLRPDTPDEILDEATININTKLQLPVSITVGKTVMPFGVFESHLISDSLTKKIWETNQVGIIVGYSGNIVKASGALYDSSNNEDVDAVAFQVFVNPAEDFTIGASYKNYPEDVGTETTESYSDVSAMFTYTKGRLTLDAEYCSATKRGKGEGKPSAYFIALAYKHMDPLEIALRYENFDDDDDETISTKSKVSCGLNYLIAEETTLSIEYTKNNSERDKDDRKDGRNELYAKLALKF